VEVIGSNPIAPTICAGKGPRSLVALGISAAGSHASLTRLRSRLLGASSSDPIAPTMSLGLAMMNRPNVVRLLAICLFLSAVLTLAADSGKSVSVKGYVLDSACTFVKNLKKPVSPQCAVECAKAGSPLVILADDGTIYWPISDTTPSAGQNEKLLPFAGKRVTVSGKAFQRGGSSALVIEKIEVSTAQ
jgi:hypothetical protein